jgi:hypothetical protein
MGIDQRSRASTPSFIAKTSSWGKRSSYGLPGASLICALNI